MTDLNKHVITPQSTEYLTPRIESNNFIDNAATLILDAAFSTDGSFQQTPRVYRTGNIVCYLTGTAIAQAAVASGDLIASVPSVFSKKTLFGQNNIAIPVSTVQGGSLVIASIDIGNSIASDKINITYTGTALAANDTISLNGIVFFVSNE